MSLPLKIRKAIKEMVTSVQGVVEEIGAALGVTLVFVDNSTEVYTALGEANGENVGAVLSYFTQFKAVVDIFLKDATRKQVLIDTLNASQGKIGLKIVPEGDAPEKYFSHSAEGFWIEVTPRNWGSWQSMYNDERLEAVLDTTEGAFVVPCATKRGLAHAKDALDAELKRAGAALGFDLEWDVDFGAIFKWWNAYAARARDDSDLSVGVKAYAKQMADVVVEFCKDADNKEALVEQWSGHKVGFELATSDASAKYWVWKGGNLYIEVQPNYWGSWVSSHKGEALEATL